jgi:hypothetical protein
MLVSLVLCVGWNFANCVQGLRSFLVWRACRCKRYCRVRLSSESALKEVVVWNFVGVVGSLYNVGIRLVVLCSLVILLHCDFLKTHIYACYVMIYRNKFRRVLMSCIQGLVLAGKLTREASANYWLDVVCLGE